MLSSLVMSFRSTCIGVTTFMAMAIFGSSAAQAGIAGSCDGYFEDPRAVGEILDTGEVTRANPIPILRDGAEVFENANGNGLSIKKLTFGDRVFITHFENGFYKVALDTRKDDTSNLGWVHGDDLLCRNRPVLSPEGISRKFYVRTKASFVDEEQGAITAKSGPRTDECAGINGRCRELSRFTLYYVYASDEVFPKGAFARSSNGGCGCAANRLGEFERRLPVGYALWLASERKPGFRHPNR